MGNQNYIVINGKKYDALTGKQLSGSAHSKSTQVETISAHKKPMSNVGVVDGFSRPKKRTNPHSSVNYVAKSQQKSQTLARKAVHKPSEPHAKQQEIAKPGIAKRTLGNSPRREYMAKEVQKSPQVHKYGVVSARSSVVKKLVEKPVKQPPTHQGTHKSTPTTHKNTQRVSSGTTTSKHRAHQNTNAMLENAVAHAQSHNQPPVTKHKKRGKIARKLGVSRRTMAISSAALAGALLIGFYALQNIPNLSMQVASTRAGFDAHMPAYTPAGFSFKGPIQYEPGRVTISFKANADNRSYSLTQQSSNWNSDALVANFIETISDISG